MSTTGITGSGLITPFTINSSGGLSSGSTLTNTGAGGTLQLTGLASGINTTQLIQAELAQRERPLLNMQAEVSALNTENNTLSSLQTSLETASFDAEIIGEPSMFFSVQTITSSNPNMVAAATTNGPGAPIGSSTLTVTNLATAAQTTYNWTAPSASDTLTFNVQSNTGTAPTLTISAGETAEQVAGAVNRDSTLDVYATVQTSGSGQQELVFSAARTGSGSIVNVTDTAAALSGSGTNPYVSQQDGANATYYVNGVQGTSASDTVTNAIPGVTLTLLGVTGPDATTNPVTITAQAPGPSISLITQAVQQFVSDYNNALDALNSAINTAPASETTPSAYSPYSGSLFGDVELEQLMSDVRTAMQQDVSGAGVLPTLNNLSQIGITSGDTSGTVTSAAVVGHLTVNASALAAAIQSNPNGVQALLSSWSSSFQSVVNNAAGVSGAISQRIQGNSAIIRNLNSQLSSQEALYAQEETNMEAQWAQVEATLQKLDNQKTNFSLFTGGLSGSSSTHG